MTAAKTLLLDQSYQPVKVISWQRAITLLTLDKVEVVSEYDDKDLRSTFLVIKMPAVVRLLRAFKRNKKPVKFSRHNIAARDRYKCQYCGVKLLLKNLTYDHVIPRYQGGKTTWGNIVSACSDCNTKKGSRTPQQAGMRLLKAPYQPKWVPSVTIALNRRSVPDAWRDFLYWTEPLDADN